MSTRRQTPITGVNQAMRDGARQSAACDVIGISAKTLQRSAQPENVQDGRLDAHPKPSTTFTPSEREQIIKVASALAADLMTDICHREGVVRDCVTLHSDNGSRSATCISIRKRARQKSRQIRRRNFNLQGRVARGNCPLGLSQIRT